jgi:hypothetical protein
MKNFIYKAFFYAGLLLLLVTPIFFSAEKDGTVMKEKSQIEEEDPKLSADELLEDQGKDEQEEENYEVVKFYTYDKKVHFTILNTDGYPPLALESLKRDLDIVYKNVNLETKDYFQQQTEVYVTLKVDMNAGDQLDAASGYMNIYNYDPETEWLYYLAVRSIFQEHDHYKNFSKLPKEVLALYFEIFYGSIDADPYASDFISYLDQEGKRIPLEELLSAEKYNEFDYDEYVTDDILFEFETNYYWFVHLQAVSFATFFIDTYGMESYASVYELGDLIPAIEEISGKSLPQLEKEWLEYIDLHYYEGDSSDSL